MCPRTYFLFLLLLYGSTGFTRYFSPALSRPTSNCSIRRGSPDRMLLSSRGASSTDDNEGNLPDASQPWSPGLRKVMTGVASLGVVETAYLTFSKLSHQEVLCSVGGSCGDVLNGPYAYIPSTDIPISAVGLMAYSLLALIAAAPLIWKDGEDDNNRIALLVLVTAMGTFSVFLVSLLLNVLHQSCLYCFASASFSWTLAACAWLGGALPEEPQEHKIRGLQASAFSFLVSVGASVTLFASIDTPPAVDESNLPPQSPPAITTSSSTQALVIGKELKRLNAKMYGAFWCSHCYDQKQTLGREAFTESVQYIECSKDGVNTQYQFCRDKVIPGYPTWEINGEFYPGEQDLDELQEIIEKAKVAAASKRQ